MMRGGILANRRLLEDKIHGCFVHKDSLFCFLLLDFYITMVFPIF